MLKQIFLILLGIQIGFWGCFYGISKPSVKFAWTKQGIAGYQHYRGCFKVGETEEYWKATTSDEQRCVLVHFNYPK